MTVWGGACHINSEVVTQGRQAILGWHFEGGAFAGTPLGGARAAACVESGESLHLGHPLRVSLWVDASSRAQADALVGWLRAGPLADADLQVTRGPVRFCSDGGALDLEVPGMLELKGTASPDTDCCTMPETSWFRAVDSRSHGIAVGVGDVVRVHGSAGLESWSYNGANSLQFGRFGE